jgi:hypothetical protein
MIDLKHRSVGLSPRAVAMPRDNSGESSTITDVDEELRLFSPLIPPEHIRQQRPVFSEILDAL